MSQQDKESRSTAYVFGELSKDETAEFEQELQQSTELQSEIASIREAVAALEAEFDSQATGVSNEGRQKIEQAMSGLPDDQRNSTALSKTESRTGGHRMILGLAIAASLLVVAGLVLPKLARHDDDRPVLAKAMMEDASVEQAAMEGAGDREPGSSEDGGSAGSSSGRSRPRVTSSGKSLSRTAPFSSANKRMSGQKLDADQTIIELESRPESGAVYGDVAASTAPMPSQPEPVHEIPAQPVASALDVKDFGMRHKPLETQDAPSTYTLEAKELAKKEAESLSTPFNSATTKTPMPAGQLAQQARPEVRFKQQAEMTVIESQRRPQRGRIVAGRELKHLDRLDSMQVIIPQNAEPGQGIGPHEHGDRHDVIEDNPFMEVDNAPLSTFSIDVDTAAYAKVRMYLMQQNSMPRPDAVRIEEMVNYFTYDYAPPEDDHPFSASMEVAACPWNAKHRLARIGIKGKEIENDRPSSNLVFLLDVSGSMNKPNKHPLVVEGMKMLVDQLTENDSVAIVVYAGAAGLVLDSTTGDQKQTIVESLERLRAGGSTNGGQGITLAYQIARDNFITGGTNRVILCSDGDFNVGVTGTDELVRIAQENAKGNIFLSVLGFGMGNHNDSMMEQISNKGNGNYAFIDSKAEARKVLVEEMGATLVTIAKDVKIQVEFNPKKVSSYRLIGYENRMLAAQDFNDDTKDAGEIGAGHTVTALYELVPADVESDVAISSVDDLRYQKKAKFTPAAATDELLALKIRYKQPEGTKSTKIEIPVDDSEKSFTKTDQDFQFAASVAAFGMLLRNSPHKGDVTYAAVEEIANGGISNDPGGYRAEFLQMVARAKELSGE